MMTMETQLDILMRLAAADTEAEKFTLQEELRRMLEKRRHPGCADPEYLIREILLELGAPDHLVGHPYVIEAILLVVEDRTYIDSITFGLYPQLAARFDTTAARVERAIRHLIEVTWMRGDIDILSKYFGNTISMDKGKPTNGEFIARLSNVVKQQMKQLS